MSSSDLPAPDDQPDTASDATADAAPPVIAPPLLQAVAPGKIILSGEHAVVYGCPALVLAVNATATAGIRQATEPAAGLRLNLHDFQQTLVYTAGDLATLKARVHDRLQAFLDGKLNVADVLPHHYEMVPFALALVLDETPDALLGKLQMDVKIHLPIGCGMGSSAATGLSVLRLAWAIQHGPDTPIDDATLLDLSLACERLLHGRPSGVDSMICLHGGCLRFEAGRAEVLTPPPFALSFFNTGTPAASTGECVEAVSRRFYNGAIWRRFHAVTDGLEDAMLRHDLDAFKQGIRNNHALLCEIGVVPERVRLAVAEIEARGGAAKLCGAGSIRGDGGGVLLVVEQAPPGWRPTWNFRRLKLEIDPHGTRLL